MGGSLLKTALYVCAAALLMLAVACKPATEPQQKEKPEAGKVNDQVSSELKSFEGMEGDISIAGGTAHIPVMEAAQKTIMTAYPKISITVEGGGSGKGVEKVGAGTVDIGNAGRPLTEEEIAEYGLKSYPFAVDGVAVVVHPDNPVEDLSTAQMINIYAGNITNWKDVGGADQAINIFTREEGSGTRKTFWSKLLGKGKIIEDASFVGSNGEMRLAIAGDPGAIGYVGIGHIDETVKAPKLDGVAPSQENAASGAYPIVRKLYMNTKGEPSDLVKAFIDYIWSPDGQQFCADAGYIPYKPE